jgi:O-antigen/teichoic acid export membrane protein
MFSEMIDRYDDRSKLYHGGLNLILGMAFTVAVPIIVFRDLIMNFLYTETTEGSIQSLSILLVAFLWKSSLFVTSALLTAHKMFKALTWLFALSVIVNITSNVVAIPIMKIIGASWATLASQVFVALGCLYFVHHKKLVNNFGKGYIRILLFGVLSVLLGILFTFVEIASSWMSFVVLLWALGVLYLLLNFNVITQLSREFQRR